jgi:hypothetical protein
VKKLGFIAFLSLLLMVLATTITPRKALAAAPTCFIKAKTTIAFLSVTTKIVGPVPCEGKAGEGVLNIPNFHEINKEANHGEDLQDDRCYFIVANQAGIDWYDGESEPCQNLKNQATALPGSATGTAVGSLNPDGSPIGTAVGSIDPTSNAGNAASGSTDKKQQPAQPAISADQRCKESSSFNQSNGDCTLQEADQCALGGRGENCSINSKVNSVTNFLSAGVGIIIVIMIIVGGIQYTTAGGDPQKVASAKGHILNAIIALVAFFFLFAFLQWVVPGGIF